MDMHSHAGRVSISRDPAIGANRPFVPLAAPMHSGGMNVVTLAIVTDTVVTRVSSDRKRFEAYRPPAPGELYALGQTEFARVHALIEPEQLNVITDSASLKARANAEPSAIIASEGRFPGGATGSRRRSVHTAPASPFATDALPRQRTRRYPD